jgi:hypothetical protein
MRFHVGAFIYTLILADRRLYDENGVELEARALESPRVMILSCDAAPQRRFELLRHELEHAWCFHIPAPTTEEERANLAAFIDQQFLDDLDAQGGREALLHLEPTECPVLGRPAPAGKLPTPREILGLSDRVDCGCCGSPVMCGSIVNGEPELHAETRTVRIQRWMECPACGSVQVWTELCTADGTPLGEFVSNPAPRLLRGRDASRWLAEHRVMMQTA